MKLQNILVIVITAVLTQPILALSSSELADIRDGFEARRDEAFELLRGQELEVAEKREPLSEGRGLFTRHFSYSIVDFAMKSFWLNEKIEQANDALDLNSKFYISDRKTRNDRDSFYWAADVLCRIVEFFGSDGSIAPGRLRKSSEDLILEMMWVYSKENSLLDSRDKAYEIYERWTWGQMDDEPLPLSAEIEKTKTWDIIGSENHDLMKFTTLWHFAKFLSSSAEYKNLKYDDGHTAAEHYAAWTEYAKEYCRQRAKKGFFAEMADDTYNAHSLKNIFNFYDFAEDDRLKEIAGNLITVYFASWAQEQINGIRGGGKNRMNHNKPWRTITPIRRMMWFYVGMGEPAELYHEFFTIVTSDYRMPLVVIDLILDTQGRGSYEVINRVPGLAAEEVYTNPRNTMRTDYGGIVRYSYCTPEFIIGMPILEAREFEDWILFSSQSRWQGVIFAGDINSRIFAECKPEQANSTFNQQWGVQRKGTMITQRLDDKWTRGTEEMKIWISNCLENRVGHNRWLFVESQGAYAAVRPARGSFSLQPPQSASLNGGWVVFEDGFSPAIIEVAPKDDFETYRDFQRAIVSLPLDWDGDVFSYTGLSGDEFTFYADYSNPPKINGEDFNYAPEHTFKSPFLNSKWDSGLVTITKADRELELDFN